MRQRAQAPTARASSARFVEALYLMAPKGWVFCVCLGLLYLFGSPPAYGQSATSSRKSTQQHQDKHVLGPGGAKPTSSGKISREERRVPLDRQQLARDILFLERDTARLKGLLDGIKKELTGPMWLLGVGGVSLLLSAFGVSLLPYLLTNSFGWAYGWLGLSIGATLAFAGLGMVIAGGIWHHPLKKKSIPYLRLWRERMSRLRAYRAYLKRQPTRQARGVITLPQSAVSKVSWSF